MKSILEVQRAAFNKVPNLPWVERKTNLKKLGALISKYEDEFVAAISSDFGNRAVQETITGSVSVFS